jgi:hypothetical protein
MQHCVFDGAISVLSALLHVSPRMFREAIAPTCVVSFDSSKSP